jgi:hypothetical protein
VEYSPRAVSVRAAVISQLVAAIYLQVVEWVDLFPWNNVAHGNRQEGLDVILLLVQAVVIWAFLRRTLWLMVAGWGFYAVWLWLQVVTWWKPYLFGGRRVGPNWWFARTYKFLPAIDQRPVPDANHVVLQLLILVVLAIAGVAIVSVVRAGASRRRPA